MKDFEKWFVFLSGALKAPAWGLYCEFSAQDMIVLVKNSFGFLDNMRLPEGTRVFLVTADCFGADLHNAARVIPVRHTRTIKLAE